MKYWRRLSGQQRPSVDEHDMPTEPVPYPNPAQEPGYAQDLYDPSPYDERTTAAPPPISPPQGGGARLYRLPSGLSGASLLMRRQILDHSQSAIKSLNLRLGEIEEGAYQLSSDSYQG
ncbi:hypothetical protein [Ktedonospora formicarum]|uniref:Uncharacterized protein n=1 Tax=Ktedonospora formicarum TaxID=2778364 RepID=A0A8J3MQV6_9CHLR|nr:hypothetical protein [Ktedonospora formicarum]GHO43018.1 hypothetical protein KSX_11810 [Ktedonospora formicarum]